MRFLGLSLAFVVSVCFSSAYAGKKGELVLTPPETAKPYSKKQYKKLLRKAKRTYKRRRIAAVDRINYELIFSGSAKDLHSRIIGGPVYDKRGKKTKKNWPGLKKPSDVAELAAWADNDDNYNALDTDAKLVAAQFALVKPLRGILHRARPLIEDHRFAHSAILTMVRAAATGINIYFPTEEWDAGFKYISHPYGDRKSFKDLEIENDNDFKMYVFNEILPSIKKFHERMKALNLQSNIYFDNRTLYSTSSIADDRDRFLMITDAEIQSLQGSASLAMAGIYASMAYSWRGLFESVDDMAKVYGFDAGARIGRIRGATAKKRVDVVKDHESLGVIMGNGPEWTKGSYRLAQRGVQEMRLAWTKIKGNSKGIDPDQINPFIDPRVVAPFNRIIGDSLDNIEKILRDDEVSSLLIDGETVQISVSMFRDKPPKDLKMFLATSFDEADFIEKRDGFKFRNYLSGSPTGWNIEFYQQYFPGVKNNNDVKKRARIFNQTWGGLVVGGPFMAALF